MTTLLQYFNLIMANWMLDEASASSSIQIRINRKHEKLIEKQDEFL